MPWMSLCTSLNWKRGRGTRGHWVMLSVKVFNGVSRNSGFIQVIGFPFSLYGTQLGGDMYVYVQIYIYIYRYIHLRTRQAQDGTSDPPALAMRSQPTETGEPSFP